MTMRGQTFEVGRRYPGGGFRFPMPEVAQYNFDEAGHVLQLFWPGVSEWETKAVRKGEASFALAVVEPAIFFCYRFGNMPWSDSAYSVHLVPEERRSTTGIDSETGEPRNLLEVHLVDARSGVLRAMRAFGLDRDFTDAFEEALQKQLAAGWHGQADYEMALAAIYRRFSRSSDLARAAVVRQDFSRKVGA